MKKLEKLLFMQLDLKLVNDLPINEIEIEELANDIDTTALSIEERIFHQLKVIIVRNANILKYVKGRKIT